VRRKQQDEPVSGPLDRDEVAGHVLADDDPQRLRIHDDELVAPVVDLQDEQAVGCNPGDLLHPTGTEHQPTERLQRRGIDEAKHR
jgi:hypothetical protein